MVKKRARMRRLIVISQGNVQEIEVGQELTIGRAYTNLLRLEGEEVSRVHAIIYRREDDYILRDLDSKNGVYLNGQRVMSSIVVPGDEIQIGTYTLVFDPPADFDVEQFMKQRSLVPVEKENEKDKEDEGSKHKVRSHRLGKRVTKDEETDERFETSIHFVPDELTQVFYELSEIDEASQTDVLPQSGIFTTELVRALRCLTAAKDPERSDEDWLYEQILKAAMAATHADRGVLVLKDPQGESLRLGALLPRERDVSVTRVVLRAVLREQRAVLCNDAQRDPRFQRTETVQRENIASLLGFPLVADGQTVGLIYVDTQGRPNAFRREHLIIMNFLARICLLAMRHAVEPEHK